MNNAIANLAAELSARVKDAIQNQPGKSYFDLALEFGVSVSFINNKAAELKAETGFSRGRGNRKVKP